MKHIPTARQQIVHCFVSLLKTSIDCINRTSRECLYKSSSSLLYSSIFLLFYLLFLSFV